MSVALRVLQDTAEDMVQTVFTEFYQKAHLFAVSVLSLSRAGMTGNIPTLGRNLAFT
jgi:hypothetical protein